MGVISFMRLRSSARETLALRRAVTTTVERSNSTADQRNDYLLGTVKHRFMQMMEVHDRVRARFLTAPQPSGHRISPD